jgi:peptidoglycan/LPS O-acetylase OafA/YrhL
MMPVAVLVITLAVELNTGGGGGVLASVNVEEVDWRHRGGASGLRIYAFSFVLRYQHAATRTCIPVIGPLRLLPCWSPTHPGHPGVGEGRIAFLDGLRGVAILLVILFHAFARWPEVVPYGDRFAAFPIFQFGWAGVDLFFLISGYVILMSLERCCSAREFLVRRFIRLFPAMLLCSLLIFATAGLFPERPAGIPAWTALLPGLTFSEPWLWTRVLHVPVDRLLLEGSFWSLYVEWKFYLVAAAAWFLGGRRALFAVLVGLFAFGTLVLALADDAVGGALARLAWLVHLSSITYFGWFAAGAAFRHHDHTRDRRWFAAAVVLAVLSAFATTQPGCPRGAVVFAALAAAGVFVLAVASPFLQRALSLRALLFIGAISYPLYLIHQNLLVAAIVKLHRCWAVIPDLALPILPVALLMATAYAIMALGERPLHQALYRLARGCGLIPGAGTAPVAAAVAVARWWLVLVAALAVAIGSAQALFVWNHFYRDGAYLYDSGWHANLCWHDGLIPVNPLVGQYTHHYFKLHLRLILSFLSGLSYLVPLSRVAWYALILGTSYGLVAVAPGLLVRDRLRRARDGDAMCGEIALGAFLLVTVAYCGPVRVCWFYPHFEVAISAAINLAVYAWAVGRYRLALVACAAAASVREDGALIAAGTFAAVGLWWWREGSAQATGATASGVTGAGRWTLRLCLFCLALAVGVLATQKACFGANSKLHEEYLGNGGLPWTDVGELARRMQRFLLQCPFIWMPASFALVLALRRRSLLPMVGWIAVAPYVLINFLAMQARRAEFNIYFSFPFVIALFIPLVLEDLRLRCGAGVDATRVGRRSLLAVGLCAALSAVVPSSAQQNYASIQGGLALTTVEPDAADTDQALTTFLARVGPADYLVDNAMASLVIAVRDPSMDQLVSEPFEVVQGERPLLFAAHGLQADTVIGQLIAAGRQDVWRADHTIACAWLPAGATLPPPWHPADLIAAQFTTITPVHRDQDRFVIGADVGAGVVVATRALPLRPGVYEADWRVDDGAAASDESCGDCDVVSGDRTLGATPVPSGTAAVAVLFTVSSPAGGSATAPATLPVQIRFAHRAGAGLGLTFAGLRCIHADAARVFCDSHWVQGVRMGLSVPPVVPGTAAEVTVILQRQASGIGPWGLSPEEPLTFAWEDAAGHALDVCVRPLPVPARYRDMTNLDCAVAITVPVPGAAALMHCRFRDSALQVDVPCASATRAASP